MVGSCSPIHKGEQYTPLIGDLDVVAWPGTVPIQSPHLLCPSMATTLMGI
jgi:hypothetical protein